MTKYVPYFVFLILAAVVLYGILNALKAFGVKNSTLDKVQAVAKGFNPLIMA